MSALYVVKTGVTATALVAATAKTVVNLISGANRVPLVTQFSISFDGVTASAVPVNLESCLCTQGAAGTPGTSPTPTLIRGKGASQSTAGVDYSAEPTAVTPYDHGLVTPNGGLIVLQYPLGREPEADLSGGTNKSQLLRATAPANVNCRASAWFEE